MTAIDNLALTGYGHFTTMRVEHGAVRGLTLHLDRLVADCATVFGTELSRTYVRECIRTVLRDAAGPLTVRVTVADPELAVTHPAAPSHPQIFVTTRAASPVGLPPLRVRSVRHDRGVPAVKHTGLFGSLYERRRAQLDGYDDALFVDGDGSVSEGVTWNVGFVASDSTLIWPRAQVLSGVTMRLVAGAHTGPQRTEPVPLAHLPTMVAAFATNSAGGIRPVASIDTLRFSTAHEALDLLARQYAGIEPEYI
ncbi:aminotransferase class IV [Couchioplanes caeruleus]|uniref:PabC n=2 Tax=Couchioplanes caeruleus TaxID=56438 RepID=A0A1K0FTW9_9ACTN|nr:aminotransferase class IV [Couchioplanes caeruleus]OJF16261.1 PabC [Couchioplanes caeruleus subsp. caeruleus]ROP28387.1 branched-subunit amino acid aminotransferase/4-amino-4-deoxychorismate lyase [Couchioplanes caeruleus]